MREIKDRINIKTEVKFAFDNFKIKYKKITKGITELYDEIMFSTDLKELKKFHAKFFGYLIKSKNAKEKWKK